MDDWWVHTASVATCTGTGVNGDVYAAPVDVPGFLDQRDQLVITAQGEEAQSETVFYTDLSEAGAFTPRSTLTCNGITAQVTKVFRRDGGGLPTPDHLEVRLS